MTCENAKKLIEKKLNFPKNKDVILREFSRFSVHGYVFYIEGMASGDKISEYILRPILSCSCFDKIEDTVQIPNIKREPDADKMVNALLQGDCVLLLDCEPCGFICETKGFAGRGVEKPQVENSIVGAQQAFNESIRTNTTLIRRIIKSPSLTTEFLVVGETNNLSVAIMYIDGLAQNALISEIKRRICEVKLNFVQSGGMLEQLIEDHPSSIFQTVTTTERADNAAALVSQGRVAIIVDGSPRVIIAPITLFSILKTSEEAALRAPFASAVRLIRLFSVFLSLFAPALYLAITTFHPEMIPAGLLLSIAKSRINIPYPAIFELILMEISFELIREASRNIPGSLGSTIGIVGGLILGQAAVSAGFVSQGCVIIIAVTGLGNFAIPQYQTSFTTQILRLIFLICGGFLGFFGIAIAFVVLVAYLNSMSSFGTEYLQIIFKSGAPVFPKKAVGSYDHAPESAVNARGLTPKIDSRDLHRKK